MSEEDASDEVEDWFERALREERETVEGDDDTTGADGNDAAKTDDGGATETGEGGGMETDEGGGVAAKERDDSEWTAEEGSEQLFGGESGASSSGEPSTGEGDGSAGGSGFGGEDPFGRPSGEEDESATPFGEGSDTGGFDVSGFGPDSGTGDASNPWASDAAVTGDDGGPFDDEGFASAFEAGGGGEGEFEDEEFESAIPRIDIGIEGLDAMIHGGIPERHLVVAIGGAGTGKTTFGLQFLQHGLENGQNAVFITLEQSHESILATANEFGWDFEGYESEGSLAIVDLDPVEMANSLDNIQAELPALIENFGADRLVLDSVSLLEMMYDNPAKRRTEVYDFTRSLKKGGVTTFLTSEASESNPYASRHGTIEYLTDAVFVLKFVRGETQETRLAIEIQKIRNANHSREMKPYELTDDGISVYRQANIF